MVRTVRARTEGLAAVRGQPVGDARLGDRGGAPFGLVPERVRARPAPAGYPAEWAGRSWMIRALAGFRCEHCGRCFPLVDSAKRRLVCTISTATASTCGTGTSSRCAWSTTAWSSARCTWIASSWRCSAPASPGLDRGWRQAPRPSRPDCGHRAAGVGRQQWPGGEPGILASDRRKRGTVLRYCACGCGRPVGADRWARYATDACRVRAFRARRGRQRDLMELLEADSGGREVSPSTRGGW